jgi:phosphate starvation-inducible PhoH-like protein
VNLGEQAVMTFAGHDAFRHLCGPQDKNLKVLSDMLDVSVNARGNTLNISGIDHDVALARTALEQLYELTTQGYPLYPSDVATGLKVVASGSNTRLSDIFLDNVLISSGKRRIAPKNLSQKTYIDAIRNHSLTLGVGPAGTGKTYLAMAMAVAALTKGEVKRIVLTRPAVEAGERLGFLPGDMAEKVNPYLRPLYDALHEMLDVERTERMIQDNTIEVAPLAFMRGRTLSDAFIVLDEAQNTTREQMRMFLTRLGFNSRTVVTGDVTQTDLRDKRRSGLDHARRILNNVSDIAICHFGAQDVVRHPLVARIINAYEADDKARHERQNASPIDEAS